MTLFELAAVLTLNKSSFDKGVSEAEGETKSLGDKLKSGLGTIGKVGAATVGAAATAVGGLASQSLQAFSSYEQLVGGIETLFGTGGKSLEEYAKEQGKAISEVESEFKTLEATQTAALKNADNAYATAGLSANEYMETVTSFAASLKQSLGEDAGLLADYADQAIIDMSDNSSKMGTAMESIQNAYQGFAKQNYTMLDNLKLGYGGTKEEMQRLLNDAEKLNGLELGTYDISNFADIVSAIHTVQTELGITGTTAKEASGTIEGSTASMKAAWDNFIVALASDNGNISGTLGALVNGVITTGQNIIPRMQEILTGIGSAISEAVPLITETLVPMLTDSSLIDSLLNAGAGLVDALVEGISSNIEPLTNAAMNVALKVVDTIGKNLPKLLSMGLSIVKTLAEGLSQNAGAIVDSAVSVVTEIATTLTDPETLTGILDAGLQILMSLGQGILDAIPTLIEALPTVIQNIVDFLLNSIPMIIDASAQLLTSLVSALPDIISAIVAAIPKIIDGIINAVIGAIPQIIQAGVQLLVSLIQNLPTIITEIVKAIPQIIEGIVTGVLGNLDKIIMAGVQLFVSLIQNLPTIIVEIVKAVPQIIGGIVDAFGSLMGSIVEIGGNLLKGIWDGICGAADWLWSQIEGFFGGIVDGICDFLGIHSPSRVFADIGKNMALGAGEGFDDEFAGIRKDINDQLDFSGSADVAVNSRRNYIETYSRAGEPGAGFTGAGAAAATTAQRQPLVVVVQLSSGLEVARAIIEDINDARRLDGLPAL